MIWPERYRPTRSLRAAIAFRISVRASVMGTFSATWRSTVISAAASPTYVSPRAQSTHRQLKHFANGYRLAERLPFE
jgi:hypothetical protein